MTRLGAEGRAPELEMVLCGVRGPRKTEESQRAGGGKFGGATHKLLLSKLEVGKRKGRRWIGEL